MECGWEGWGRDPSTTRSRLKVQNFGQAELQGEQVPVEKWGPRLLKEGREHTEGPGRAVQTEREQVPRKSRVWPAPDPTRALTLGDPLPSSVRSEAWPGVPGQVPGRPGAEQSSPAMCWRRASSRCVDSMSPMARRSRGRIRPPLLRRTPLAPWSPQAPLPPPRSLDAAWAPLHSHRDPRRVPPAGRCCLSSRRPGPGARPAPTSQATPLSEPRPPLQSRAGGDL